MLHPRRACCVAGRVLCAPGGERLLGGPVRVALVVRHGAHDQGAGVDELRGRGIVSCVTGTPATSAGVSLCGRIDCLRLGETSQ